MTKQYVLAGLPYPTFANETVGTQEILTNVFLDETFAAVANQNPPTITGLPIEGQTLTGSLGTWSGTPPIYRYGQWMNGSTVLSSDATYVVQASDIGANIDYVVKAFNSPQTSATASAEVGPVTPAPAVNLTPPSISGVKFVGQLLTCNPGTWTSSTAITYQYQWTNSGGIIPLATNSTYTAQDADSPTGVGCIVTAVNGAITPATATVPTYGPILKYDITLTATRDNHQYAEVGDKVYDGVLTAGGPALASGGFTLTSDPSGCYEVVQTSTTTFEVWVKHLSSGGAPIVNSSAQVTVDNGTIQGAVAAAFTVGSYDPAQHLLTWVRADAQGAGPFSGPDAIKGTGTLGTVKFTPSASISLTTVGVLPALNLAAGQRIVCAYGQSAVIANLFGADNSAGGVFVVWTAPATGVVHDWICWRNPTTAGGSGGAQKMYVRQQAFVQTMSTTHSIDGTTGNVAALATVQLVDANPIVGNVIAPGSGYTGASGVSMTGGHGSGAVAALTVVSGGVTSIALSNIGSGYLPGDILSPSGVSGSGCQFELTDEYPVPGSLAAAHWRFNGSVTDNGINRAYGVSPGESIWFYKILNGGGGYATGGPFTVTNVNAGQLGSGATLTITGISSGGVVSGLTMDTRFAAYYAHNDVVTITGAGGSGLQVQIIKRGARATNTFEIGGRDGSNPLGGSMVAFGVFDGTMNLDPLYRYCKDTFGTPAKAMGAYVDTRTFNGDFLERYAAKIGAQYAPRGSGTWTVTTAGLVTINAPLTNWIPRYLSTTVRTDTGTNGAITSPAEEEWCVDPTSSALSAYDPNSRDTQGWTMTASQTPSAVLSSANNMPYLSAANVSLGSIWWGRGVCEYSRIQMPRNNPNGAFPAWWAMPASSSYTAEWDFMEEFGYTSTVHNCTFHGYVVSPGGAVNARCVVDGANKLSSGPQTRRCAPIDFSFRPGTIGMLKASDGIWMLYQRRKVTQFQFAATGEPAITSFLHHPHYLLMNHAVASYGNAPTPTDYPNSTRTGGCAVYHRRQDFPPSTGGSEAATWAGLVGVTNTKIIRAISDMIERRAQVFRDDVGFLSADPFKAEFWDTSVASDNWSGLVDMWIAHPKLTLLQTKTSLKTMTAMTGGSSVTLTSNGWKFTGGGSAADVFDTGISLLNTSANADLFGGRMPPSSTMVGTIIAGGSGYTATSPITGVSLAGGHGSGAVATLTTNTSSPHNVTAVAITAAGSGYLPGDVLTPTGITGSGCQWKIYTRGFDLGIAIDFTQPATNTSSVLPIVGSGANNFVGLSQTKLDHKLYWSGTHDWSGASWTKALPGPGRLETLRCNKSEYWNFLNGALLCSGQTIGVSTYDVPNARGGYVMTPPAGNLIIGSHTTTTPGAQIDGLRSVEIGRAPGCDYQIEVLSRIMTRFWADMDAA